MQKKLYHALPRCLFSLFSLRKSLKIYTFKTEQSYSQSLFFIEVT